MENSSQSSSSSSSSSSASSSSSSSSSTTVNPISQGCGLHTQISVHINPTTGGDFYLTVDNDIAVDNLKKLVSKRLKVPRDRICLLFRDKQLQDGNLTHYGITDGSRITLLPNVETGLITQRPEIGIMQALESLNDTQVNEFLCGKAPLNLSMRLGDHMMLIQLQLSTVSGTKPPLISTPTSSSSPPSPAPPPIPPPPPPSSAPTSPPSLLQASRNLQHTLRRLSADVFSGRDKGRRESVYSGTFSGALNPALQDPKGRPRRDVATIVHILNDLLCSVPEFRRVNNNSNNNNNNNTNSNDVDKNREEPVVPVELDEDLPIITPTTTTTTNNEDQNLRTRGKLEQLRLVMGERRERRRQRKQKPYSLPPTSDTDTVTA